jgi:tetratricopeptide (TPR) repeat protein
VVIPEPHARRSQEVTVKSARTPAVLLAFAFVALFSLSASAQVAMQSGAATASRMKLTTNSAAAKAEFWQGLEEWQSGAYTSGMRHFRRAVTLDNEFALARVFAEGESSSPSQAFDRAVADAARQSTEEGIVALFWREKTNLPRSLAILRAAMQLMPNEPAIPVEYAWASFSEDHPKQSLDSARAFRARFPSYAPLAFVTAYATMNAGDTAGALKAAEEYTRIAPRTSAAFGYYGAILQQLGRYDEAEVQYRKGMALLPAHADYGWDPASALAEMYVVRGRSADARAVMMEALAHVSDAADSATYTTELAGTYFATGDNRRGLQLLEQAHQLNATVGSATDPQKLDAILGEANAVFGDGRSVSTHLSRLRPVTSVDTAVTVAYYALAYGYAGQLDSAMVYSDRLANNTSVPWRGTWSHRARGLALVTAKQCERAKAELMQAADTASFEVLVARANCEQQLGHRAEAVALRDRAQKSPDFTFFRPAYIRGRVLLAQIK